VPTPLQILLDPVSLTVLGLYAVLILVEAVFPARPLPHVKCWRSRALVVFVCYFYLSSYLPLLWGDTLARYQIFDLQALDPLVAAGIAVLVYELLVYFWHRTLHRVHWLWRSFHQMHHSAERLDS
jgi:sterol desaturase/sphingolipid hydroxylase (fatty acid hydroxylase superfamily)